MANLLFYRGEETLLEYRLHSNRTSIGRADTCDVALPGDAISRTHCFVVHRDGAYEVIDRSRHGIVVDGVPTKRPGRGPPAGTGIAVVRAARAGGASGEIGGEIGLDGAADVN